MGRPVERGGEAGKNSRAPSSHGGLELSAVLTHDRPLGFKLHTKVHKNKFLFISVLSVLLVLVGPYWSWWALGAVHKVRHAIFGQFLPPHTLSHIPGPPRKYVTHLGPPRFLVGLVQKTRTNSVSIVRGVFVRGFCQGYFVWRFCSGWFLSVPLLSEYICFSRKLNITLNFMFHMYDKKIYKCDVTCSLPPCHKLSHILGPPTPLERDVLYGRPLGFSQVRFMDITALPEL